MSSESEWVFERVQLLMLRRINPDWSYRRCARELGHDAKWVRKWSLRFAAAHPVTLKTLQSVSRAPHHPPPRIPEQAKDLVVELRHELSEQFHRRAGPKLLQFGLETYCKLHPVDFKLPKATSTIAGILRERHCILPRLAKYHEPIFLPPPMEEWEMDFGEIYLGEAEGMFEFFVVADRGTSRVIYVEARNGYNAETALEAVARLFVQHGLPKRLRFDRDPRLWGAWTRDSYPAPMVRFLRVLGVEPIICPPRRPDKKPVIERCIGTLKHEWLGYFAPDTFADAYEILETFPHYHNAERPHQGRACQNRPPDEVFSTLPKLPELPQQVTPNAWLAHEQGRVYRRRVNASGTIQVDRHTYTVGSRYAGQRVLVCLDAKRRQFHILLNDSIVKTTAIQGLVEGQMEFQDYLKLIQTEARLVDLHRQAMWEKRNN